MIQVSTYQVVLQWSYTGRVQILHGGPGGAMCPVVSAGKEKNIFFKCRCKNLLFNFESFLTLKGPGFSDFGTARTNNNEICYYHTTSEILSGNIKTLELFLALIRQKILENTKFVVFPVIWLRFGVRVMFQSIPSLTIRSPGDPRGIWTF